MRLLRDYGVWGNVPVSLRLGSILGVVCDRNPPPLIIDYLAGLDGEEMSKIIDRLALRRRLQAKARRDRKREKVVESCTCAESKIDAK